MKCQNPTCDKEAVWRPVALLLPPDPIPGMEPFPVLLKIGVCGLHRLDFLDTPLDRLVKGFWEYADQHMKKNGMRLADRAKTRVEFVPLRLTLGAFAEKGQTERN